MMGGDEPTLDVSHALLIDDRASCVTALTGSGPGADDGNRCLVVDLRSTGPQTKPLRDRNLLGDSCHRSHEGCTNAITGTEGASTG